MKNADARWVLILVAGLGLALLALLARWAPSVPLPQILQAAGVPALSDPFVDLYGVAAWIEMTQRGIDPRQETGGIVLPSGVVHPTFRMNYPPAVVAGLGHLGLSPQTVPLWGWGLGLLYLLSVVLLCGRLTWRGALFWSAFVFSPASLLLVERANLDIIPFFLLVLAILLQSWPWWSAAAVAAAALLKIFPVAALAALATAPCRRRLLAAVAAGLVFIVYLLLLREEWPLIVSGLKTQHRSCFGALVGSNLLAEAGLLSPDRLAGLPLGFLLAAWVVFFAALAAGAWRGAEWGSSLPGRERFGLVAGLAIYVLLFLTGPQMDYKWTFLLLALPAVKLMAATGAPGGLPARLWLAAALAYSWWTFFSGETSLRNALLKQAVAWAILAFSALLLGAQTRQSVMAWRAAGFLPRGPQSA